ncbi:hypothetical protein U1Q18_026513 [Sarracenia purpurea var. burkii]
MLDVYGVPLDALSEKTFLLIGDIWGSAVSVDSNTVYKDVLEFGRVLVITDHWGSINHRCELKVGICIYPIQYALKNLCLKRLVLSNNGFF